MPQFLSILICVLWTTTTVLGQDIGRMADQKPVELHSGLSLSMQTYLTDRDDPLQPAFAWYVSGSPVLSVYGVSLPFRFLLSNQQRSIQQPFNEFGISPYYKWAQLHLGYFNPVYSPFTLAGKRMLGVGAELTPGKLRFAATYGRFRKPIAFDQTAPGGQTFLLPGTEPSYKQTGYAVKLGWGSAQSYIDLIYLKGADQPNEELFPADSLAPPRENAVFGLSWRLQPVNWLSWSADAAISAYTRNQFSDALADTLFPGQNLITRLIQPRESSQVFAAIQSQLTLGSKPFSMGLRYRRIDPDYQSMGAYYFQTDLQEFTLAPRLVLREGKYAFSGSIGRQTDNLYDSKLATTTRLIGSLQIQLQPSPAFGLTAMYSNYGLSQAALNPNLPDTLIIAQVSHQAVLSPRFAFGQESRHQLNPMYSYYALTGLDASIGTLTNQSVALNYGLQLPASRLSQTFSLIWRSGRIPTGTLRSVGGRYQVRQSYLQNKLAASLGAGWFRNSSPESEERGSLFTLQSSLAYRLFSGHQLQLQYMLRKNRAPVPVLGSEFTEHRLFLTYALQF